MHLSIIFINVLIMSVISAKYSLKITAAVVNIADSCL